MSTTGSMRSTPREGGYLADLIASWLGGGGGGSQQPRQLFPGLGYGQGSAGNAASSGFSDSALRSGSTSALFGRPGAGAASGPMGAPQPSPATRGVPGIGPLGPNASMWDDYGAGGGYSPTMGSQDTAYGRGRAGVPDPNYNRPRVGVSPAGVPGVAPASSGAVAAPGYGGGGGAPMGYGGAGSAQAFLAAILGGGGRY